MAERTFILYDDRAADGDTAGATVLVVCSSNKEAKTYRGDFGGMSCYSYQDKGGELVDETLEWNWFPGDEAA